MSAALPPGATMTFDRAIDRVLGHEGGYVFDARDPGGETNWGISKRSYPHLDIRNLTRDQAKAIYRTDFWDPVAGGKHPSVVYQLLDAAVNHGTGNATRMLQRAVGAADDGHWGPNSRAAYDRMSENDILILFLAERLEFFTKLARFDAFGRGWAKRIALNLRYAARDSVEV